MPFDIKSVRVGSEVKPTPLGLKTLQTLDPSVLRDLMHKQARQENNEKANIVFIDCQSKEENSGKQMERAIHLDFNDVEKMSKIKFDGIIKNVEVVYNKLLAADLVVFYCFAASKRSPAVMALYLDALTQATSKPTGYKKDQKVLLLAGGIYSYQRIPDAPGLVKYIGILGGKLLAGGSGKVPQPRGDRGDDPAWGVIYT